MASSMLTDQARAEHGYYVVGGCGGNIAWHTEDDTLEIRFRRRLASGNNNVLVARHRLGVGAAGTGVGGASTTVAVGGCVCAAMQPGPRPLSPTAWATFLKWRRWGRSIP